MNRQGGGVRQPAFWQRLVAWQRQHGRHGLPWQATRDPYRVWLSEVMLQQTQVSTVLGYYGRFLARFPSVRALADASQDDVLALWSGLGYYSRARNLHRCAQQVRDQWQGVFPQDAAALAQLPGIGASTAAAIAAFCFGERVSILDANVQRVLSRMLGFRQDLSRSAPLKTLAVLAQDLLPPGSAAGRQVMPAYTQGLMDLGALVCTPRQPGCAICPVAEACVARQQGAPAAYPVRLRRLKRSSENLWLLVLQAPSALWLHKRPQTGIWAGLYCVPVFGSEAELMQTLAAIPQPPNVWHAAAFKHVLTHKDLYLQPVLVTLATAQDAPLPGVQGEWVQDWQARGLPGPLRKWLLQNMEVLLQQAEIVAPAALVSANPVRGGA